MPELLQRLAALSAVGMFTAGNLSRRCQGRQAPITAPRLLA